MIALLVVVGCNQRSTGSSQLQTASAYEGTQLDGPAPDFRLTDQNGVAVALSDFRGKVVALAFLDPKCTDVCPLTALHFRRVQDALGNKETSVAFLAVNTNLDANSMADLASATEKWGMNAVPSWRFLLGSPEELRAVWSAYGIAAGDEKPGKPSEVQHTPGVYVLDRSGIKRWYISIPLDDPSWSGPSLSDVLQKRALELLRDTR